MMDANVHCVDAHVLLITNGKIWYIKSSSNLI